jgi:Acetyl-CoA dehydrogenase C-terminal like
VLGPSGAAFEDWLDALADDALPDGSAPAGEDVQMTAALREQIAFAHEALTALRAGAARDAEAPFRVADDFLAGVGHLLLAWAWCVSARAARRAADRGGDAAWLAERISLARHGAEWILPQAAVHWQRVRSMAALGAVPV